MLGRTEINTTMDRRKCQASSCDASNTTLEESLNYVNYYDFHFCPSEDVKKEFPGDDWPQLTTSVSQNEELPKVIPKHEIKQEKSEDSLSLIKNEEIGYEEYSYIVQIESVGEHRVLDNSEDTSIHFDILVTPQQVQCKLCGRTFKNRFTLLIHNNEHIKVAINFKHELYKSQWCDENFNSHDNMLTHIHRVHSNKIHKSVSYNKGIKQYPIGKNGVEMEYRCHYCDRICKSKTALVVHTKNIHSDYGKMFKCWCKKQFRTAILLHKHKNKHHVVQNKTKSDKKFQCDYCLKIFKFKSRLVTHIKCIHYDYGKKFDCFCGKQFRTPFHLSLHKKLYCAKVNIINNEQSHCDYCQAIFKTKRIETRHIKCIHYDYGKKNECSCGKQFCTPVQLSLHKKEQHCTTVNIMNNEQYHCDYCQKIFKTKPVLTRHIKSIHYDYGKKFECSCGKQFRTPIHLSIHKNRKHGAKVTNNQQYQCDYCHTIFKSKPLLISHMKSVHHNFCKKYECWCGKQLRSRALLSTHKKRQHVPKLKSINEGQFQCDYCHKFFRTKLFIQYHIKSVHYDYGKVFICLCGKQFRSPIHLYQHNRRMNCNGKYTNNEQFQCHICQKILKSKKYLKDHINNIHYDYGNKTFECWCGKQFRTPTRLCVHKYRQHGSSSNKNKELQCDSCGKFFKDKDYLVRHMKHVHYDYGKMFLCWCGKKFSKPVDLRRHEKFVHNKKNKSALEAQFQCHICQKFVKTKKYLKEHIKNIHYDYGKMFVCECGKQFRTPYRLKVHKRERHNHTSNKDVV